MANSILFVAMTMRYVSHALSFLSLGLVPWKSRLVTCAKRHVAVDFDLTGDKFWGKSFVRGLLVQWA